MKINRLELNNFRSAKKTAFEFSKQLNLFVGVNGAGKSTILDALSLCLSWLIKRIERENGRGSYIPDSSLTINENEGFLDIHVTETNISRHWFLSKTAKGKSSESDSHLDGVSELAETIRREHERHRSWPVIAYYPVNRVVNIIRPTFPDRDSVYNLEVYENALGGKADYQSFFKWFRLQDDILNEESTSRSKWMQQNRTWIKKRIHQLFDLIEESSRNEEKYFDQEKFEYIIKCFEKDETIYEEPRFLFRELSHAIDRMGIHSDEHFEYETIFHDLEYMFHKMGSLSSEFKDDLIEDGDMLEKTVFRVIRNFEHIRHKGSPDEKMINFLWEAFGFSLLLSLWWLSDKGKRDIENEFRTLPRPTDHSEVMKSDSIAEKLTATMRQVIKREIKDTCLNHNNGQGLHIVTNAIEQFIPEYNHLRVKRIPRPRMLIDKNEETYDLEQLSDGEKNLIALVGDIARRLAIGNPRMNNPLEGKGFILIDEIDLHLHPGWQRLVVPKLLEVFPNCQFFITTHSPQVLSHVKPDNIFLLSNENNTLSYSRPIESYGKNSDRILEDIFGVDARPKKEKEALRLLYELIQKNKLEKAKRKIEELTSLIGEDSELVKAKVLVKRKEILGK